MKAHTAHDRVGSGRADRSRDRRTGGTSARHGGRFRPRPPAIEIAVAPLPISLLIHREADEVVPLAPVLDSARPQRLPVVVVVLGAGPFCAGALAALENLVLHAWRP